MGKRAQKIVPSKDASASRKQPAAEGSLQTSTLPAPTQPTSTTSEIRNDPKLGFKVRVLLYDLQNVVKNPSSARRLDTTTDEHYISEPYFTTDEAKRVKKAVVDVDVSLLDPAGEEEEYEYEYEQQRETGEDIPGEAEGATTITDTTTTTTSTEPPKSRFRGKSVEEAIRLILGNFLDKRRASGDARPCGPHDLAPMYCALFGVDIAELRGEKFLSRLRRSGV